MRFEIPEKQTKILSIRAGSNRDFYNQVIERIHDDVNPVENWKDVVHELFKITSDHLDNCSNSPGEKQDPVMEVKYPSIDQYFMNLDPDGDLLERFNAYREKEVPGDDDLVSILKDAFKERPQALNQLTELISEQRANYELPDDMDDGKVILHVLAQYKIEIEEELRKKLEPAEDELLIKLSEKEFEILQKINANRNAEFERHGTLEEERETMMDTLKASLFLPGRWSHSSNFYTGY